MSVSHTSIEWADATWSPVRGCSLVSEGCRNCYAMRLAGRFAGPGQPYEGLARRVNGQARWTGEVRFVPGVLDQPLRWRKPRRVFVNSMSDLFHEELPDELIDLVFGVMAIAERHTFQILTKRPERMRAYMRDRDWGEAANWALHQFAGPLDGDMHLLGEIVPPLPNVHLGVSVEDQATADERIPILLDTPAAVRWISAEPLLGPVSLARRGLEPVSFYDTPRGLDWVVAGGESGPGARPCDLNWLRALRDQCDAAAVPFFLKQLGGWPDKRGGFDARLDGALYHQFPVRNRDLMDALRAALGGR